MMPSRKARQEEKPVNGDTYEPEFSWFVYNGGYKVNPQPLLFSGKNDLTGNEISEDNYIVPRNPALGVRRIYPLNERAGEKVLFDVFASLNPTDTNAILAFMNQYGMLQNERWRGDDLLSKLTLMQNVKVEIAFMKKLLEVWDAATEAPTRLDLAYLKSLFKISKAKDEDGNDTFSIFYTLKHELGHQNQFLHQGKGSVAPLRGAEPKDLQPDDWVLFAQTLVMQLLNEQLRVYPSVTQFFIDGNRQPSPRLKPENLIGAIWLQVSQYVGGIAPDGEAKIVRCMHCGERGRLSGEWIQGRPNGPYEGKYYHARCGDAARQAMRRERMKAASLEPVRPRGRPRKNEEE